MGFTKRTGLTSADGIYGCSEQYHHIRFLVDKQFCGVPRQMVRRVAGTEQGHALDGDGRPTPLQAGATTSWSIRLARIEHRPPTAKIAGRRC
jgi:hypothetical protein